MKKVTVAATQMKCSNDSKENIKNAERIIRQAAKDGANIIMLQELFSTQYFMQTVDFYNFNLAMEMEGHPLLTQMSELAKELKVVLPVSFFEKSNNSFFNSVAVIDADGTILGKYRKTHIPDDPGYYEKFYFSPGDTGFKVWNTAYARIGVGICWDQWFPEAARIMALMGAELLFYPTAIGTPGVPIKDLGRETLDYLHWQNAMLGHAAANLVPVIASNRIGVESIGDTAIKFWGASFISDNRGNKIKEAGLDDEEIILTEFDLFDLENFRRQFCLYRDRRPECYNTLFTLDGKENA